MNEMRKRQLNNQPGGYFDTKQLKMVLLDLFFAGSETTVTTTKWGILLLMLHPHWQERCHTELDALLVERENRRVRLADKSKLVVLQATICVT